MKAKAITELSTPELEKKLRDTRQALLNMNLRRHTGQVEKTHEFRATRRDIARMLTTLRSRQTATGRSA